MFEIKENKKNKRNTIVYVPFTKELHDLFKDMDFTTIGIRGYIPTCDFYTKFMRCRLIKGYGIEPLWFVLDSEDDDSLNRIFGWDEIDIKSNDAVLPIQSPRVEELYFNVDKEKYFFSLDRACHVHRKLWDIIHTRIYKKRKFWNQGRKNKRKVKFRSCLTPFGMTAMIRQPFGKRRGQKWQRPINPLTF